MSSALGFNGAQIYAMSKLAWSLPSAGSGTLPTGGPYQRWPDPHARRWWHLVFDPAGHHASAATSATTGQRRHRVLPERAAVRRHSARQPHRGLGDGEHQRAWATAPQRVSLLHTVIGSETYGAADGSLAATQKAGNYPLGQFFGEPENQLNANDDRMNQVVYAAGLLCSGVEHGRQR